MTIFMLLVMLVFGAVSVATGRWEPVGLPLLLWLILSATGVIPRLEGDIRAGGGSPNRGCGANLAWLLLVATAMIIGMALLSPHGLDNLEKSLDEQRAGMPEPTHFRGLIEYLDDLDAALGGK